LTPYFGPKPLSLISYKTDPKNEDIFVYFNVFKVSTFVENDERKITILTTNGLTNDQDIEREGRILEKGLILYFSPNENISNSPREHAELKNSLLAAAASTNLKKLLFSYEVESLTTYYRFATKTVAAKQNHSFFCELESGELKIGGCKSFV
jgi:hypothetical protein